MSTAAPEAFTISKVLRFLLILLISSFIVVTSYCPNDCNSHGSCGDYDRCSCFSDVNGRPFFTNADCSERACPIGNAFFGTVLKANDIHSIEECSNKGKCDRTNGICICFYGFEGLACERTICPNQCNLNGYCMTQQELADDAKRKYSTPWDSSKIVGCVCDLGFRGADCSQVECPSGPDVIGGYGNESGRDCSGRGTCDYTVGVCNCYTGFYGRACQNQASALM